MQYAADGRWAVRAGSLNGDFLVLVEVDAAVDA